MTSESFGAILNDFLKQTASVLYQFALGADFQAESAAGPTDDGRAAQSTAPAPQKRELTDEEADAVLVEMARRTKLSVQSSGFVNGAKRRLRWPGMRIRARIAELESSGAILRKVIE
jgi:hypothetical protein